MLLKVIRSLVLPFENLVVQSYFQMQFSLKEQLHEQEFTSLQIDVLLNVVWTHLHSNIGPTIGAWLLVFPSTPSFHLSCTHFFTTLYIHLSIPYPTIPHVLQCQCGHTIDDLNIHLLRFLCGNEHIIAHDTFWHIVATITSESKTQIQRKVSHLFPCHTHRRMDIVITRYSFQTLADVVIADLTLHIWCNMLWRQHMHQELLLKTRHNPT
jgi:hypothetical protein